MPTQKNLASWDLQLGFNLAFKRLNNSELNYVLKHNMIVTEDIN